MALASPSILRNGLVWLALAVAWCSAASANGTWKSETLSGGTRNLTYRATVPLLGKQAPVEVIFFCNTTNTKTEQGALGVEVQVGNTPALKPFRFDDFEGPDAPAQGRKLLRVVAERTAGPPLQFDSAVSGSVPSDNRFSFSMSAESRASRSNERSLLRALGEDVSRLRLVISDPKNPALKLEVDIPVAGRQADFQALLAGLR